MAPSREARQLDDQIDAFFTRCGGDAPPQASRAAYDAYAAARFPARSLRPAPAQGYCSYTLLIEDGDGGGDGNDGVLQFRPVRYRLDMAVAQRARHIFGDMAPRTEYLGQVVALVAAAADPPSPRADASLARLDLDRDTESGPACGGGGRVAAVGDCVDVTGRLLPILHAYSLSKVPGVSLAQYRSSGRAGNIEPGTAATRECRVRSFARLWARSWACASSPTGAELEKGLVGSSFRERLELMTALPEDEFGPVVRSTLADLDDILALPWVFSHGDLVPANIMVDPGTGCVTGLIDWAEAEYLPVGIGLYGLEELLGEDLPGLGFRYYKEAGRLRTVFWTELHAALPGLRETASESLLQAAQVAGILLWHGIAFDDGLLDRVVNEENDAAEMQRLRAFLLEHVRFSEASRACTANKGPPRVAFKAFLDRVGWIFRLLCPWTFSAKASSLSSSPEART